MAERVIVAIDGPSGVGKSTAARHLADRLGVPMLDTGAMYRAIGLRVLEEGVDPDDATVVERVAEATHLELRREPTTADGTPGDLALWINGEPAGRRIRTVAVTDAASRISVHPVVRGRMVELQRQWAREHGAVVEGRDIGTVVFPDTPCKFFLDAPDDVRAKRRWRELCARGEDADLATVRENLERRDARDRERDAAPLTVDESYTVIDTSEREPEEVVEAMVAAIRAVADSGH